jgi:hypothetical protein
MTHIVYETLKTGGGLASTAIELPAHDHNIEHSSSTVAARLAIERPGQQWLMRLLAEVADDYAETLIGFGREWSPESLPFRELIFAILWIASGRVNCYSSSDGIYQRCSYGEEATRECTLRK